MLTESVVQQITFNKLKIYCIAEQKDKKELSLYNIKAASSSTRWSHEAAFTNAGVSIVVASQAINIIFSEY